MTVVTNIKGASLTILDATPKVALTEGEGSQSRLKVVADQVSLPVTFFSATNNYARLCRIPANAKLKKLAFLTDAAVDAAATTGAVTFTIGVAWSDSVYDGTPPSFQGLVPSTVGVVKEGGSTTAGTNVALPSTANANDLCGTFTPSATTNPIPLTEIVFNNLATYGSPKYVSETPLCEIFNFLDGQGQLLHNPGFLDFYIKSTHAYTTVPTTAANFFLRAEYA